jgi:hypothetical protein
MAFQTALNVTQAPAVAGDFASSNPRHSMLSVPGGFVAGAGGVQVGLFAWADTSTGTILLNAGSGAPTGFIHRAMNALNQLYFTSADATTFTIPAGMGVGELFDGGDFFVKNTGSGAVTIGMKAFASNTLGTVQFATAGATVTGFTETKWFAKTAGAAGELIKMSDQPPG